MWHTSHSFLHHTKTYQQRTGKKTLRHYTWLAGKSIHLWGLVCPNLSEPIIKSNTWVYWSGKKKKKKCRLYLTKPSFWTSLNIHKVAPSTNLPPPSTQPNLPPTPPLTPSSLTRLCGVKTGGRELGWERSGRMKGWLKGRKYEREKECKRKEGRYMDSMKDMGWEGRRKD